MTATAKRTTKTRAKSPAAGRRRPATPGNDLGEPLEVCGELQARLQAVGVSVSLEEIAAWKPGERIGVRTWCQFIVDPKVNTILPSVLRGKLPQGWTRPNGGEPARKLTCDDIHPGTAAPPLSTVRDGNEFEVPLLRVKPSPLNPRTHFDQAKLAELAASLKKRQLVPVLVWSPGGEQYEIIDGERRYRAAKLARLHTLQVKLLDVTEEEAIELRGVANLAREDLTPIETARWYQQLLDRCGYTQTSLAKKLGTSQGEVSQALALLKLPEDWQQRLITRAITPMHARFLAPWTERPQVLEKLTSLVNGIPADQQPSAKAFRGLVRDAVCAVTKPASDGGWNVPFRVTPKLRAELDVVTLESDWGHKEQRAFNTKLWNQKAKEAKKRREATRATGNGPVAKRAEPTPPEHPDEEQLDEQWQAWYARAIAANVAVDSDLVLPLFLTLAEVEFYRDAFDAALAKETRVSFGWNDPAKHWAAWRKVEDIDALLFRALREALGGPLEGMEYTGLDAEAWHAIAMEFGVDPLKEWRPSKEFLELLSEPQLQTLGGGVALPDKEAFIARVIDTWPADAGIPKLLQLACHKKAARAAKKAPK